MKNVHVRNPEFSLDCTGPLKIYLQYVEKKGKKKPSDRRKEEGKEIDKSGPVLPNDGNFDFNSIKKVTASGNVVLRYTDKDGNLCTAKAEKATYDANTGEIILAGNYPSLSRGGSIFKSKTRNGFIRVYGNGNVYIPGGRILHPGSGQAALRTETTKTRPQAVTDSSSHYLLNAEGICKTYKTRTVVDQVSLNVGHGEIVGLLGPNGAGKTTSFYMVAGLVRPDEGRVIFAGEDITELPMNLRARRGMGYLPQEESIFRRLSVEDNLMAILQTRKDMTARQQKDRAQELMDRFGIAKLRRSMAIQLSGGEKRRLTIARALATNPKLLMLDEPFSGVDPIAVSDIQKIVMELSDRDGLSILITDHNVRETLHIVDRAYILFEGKVIKHGSSEEIANDPIARKQYLGDQFRM